MTYSVNQVGSFSGFGDISVMKPHLCHNSGSPTRRSAASSSSQASRPPVCKLIVHKCEKLGYTANRHLLFNETHWCNLPLLTLSKYLQHTSKSVITLVKCNSVKCNSKINNICIFNSIVFVLIASLFQFNSVMKKNSIKTKKKTLFVPCLEESVVGNSLILNIDSRDHVQLQTVVPATPTNTQTE